jgi:hypothetical protein
VSGDWYEVEVDGEPFDLCSHHSIDYADCIELLRLAGVEVTEEEIEGGG